MAHQQNTQKESSLAELFQPQIRIKYACNCTVCKGKEVDGRTQKMHANDELRWRSNKKRKNQLARIEARKYDREGKQVERLYVEIITFIHIGCMNDHIGYKLIVSGINHTPDISILTCVTFYNM